MSKYVRFILLLILSPFISAIIYCKLLIGGGGIIDLELVKLPKFIWLNDIKLLIFSITVIYLTLNLVIEQFIPQVIDIYPAVLEDDDEDDADILNEILGRKIMFKSCSAAANAYFVAFGFLKIKDTIETVSICWEFFKKISLIYKEPVLIT